MSDTATNSTTTTRPPSKSELKRQSRDLQDLGWELVELPEAELAAMPLPEDVRDAVEARRRITSNGAKARQRLYIGKLLRQHRHRADPAALDRRGEIDRQRIRREQAIERWRDRLLADEAGRLDRTRAPDRADRGCSRCASLARQARAEQAALARPPRRRSRGSCSARLRGQAPWRTSPARRPQPVLARTDVQCRGETARRHHHGVDLRLGDPEVRRRDARRVSASRTRCASSRRTARRTCCSSTPARPAAAASRC